MRTCRAVDVTAVSVLDLVLVSGCSGLQYFWPFVQALGTLNEESRKRAFSVIHA